MHRERYVIEIDVSSRQASSRRVKHMLIALLNSLGNRMLRLAVEFADAIFLMVGKVLEPICPS
jgi:hypothetical protein